MPCILIQGFVNTHPFPNFLKQIIYQKPFLNLFKSTLNISTFIFLPFLKGIHPCSDSRAWRHLSKEHVSKETVVQVTFVQGDSCPRRLLSKETIVQGRLMSKETFVQGDICPRRQLHVFQSKDIFLDQQYLSHIRSYFQKTFRTTSQGYPKMIRLG